MAIIVANTAVNTVANTVANTEATTVAYSSAYTVANIVANTVANSAANTVANIAANTVPLPWLTPPPPESPDSTMELYRPEDGSKAPVSISTFEPGSSRWEAYSNSSLHSSRSSLDSSRSQDPAPPDPALPRGPPETDQSIVPQLLIDHYVSMIDPSRAQTVDNDIARHCAFSLPAVALTLGRTNGPLLKETYESLANDMQWKVRRTLASSIHELGVILGGEVASTDLVPIFNGFIKDLDEVRIGVLKHLADFLKLLGEEERNSYLPRLGEFLKMDNERNWRFRLELTEQLGILVPIFSAAQLTQHLAPIAITLIQVRAPSLPSCS